MSSRAAHKVGWTSVIAAVLLAAAVLTAQSQSVERTITVLGNRYLLKRPVQLAVSPSGSSIALTDQQGGRIFVVDLDGNLLWGSDESLALDQPAGVCFESEDVLLFTLRDRLDVYRISRNTNAAIDTVKDLSPDHTGLKSLDQIIALSTGFLALDQTRGTIARFTPDWKFDKELVSQGQGKGFLWAPSNAALDISGNLFVAGAGSYPLQCFSPSGQFLFFAGWNTPQKQSVWEASAVFVSLQQSVWVADATSRQWRVYDMAGNQIGEAPFAPQMVRPRAAAVLPDGRVAVLDEAGQLSIMSLQ